VLRASRTESSQNIKGSNVWVVTSFFLAEIRRTWVYIEGVERDCQKIDAAALFETYNVTGKFGSFGDDGFAYLVPRGYSRGRRDACLAPNAVRTSAVRVTVQYSPSRFARLMA
jgi:hypothetical protein